MRQGTRSILFGCHSPIHSVVVTKAWRKIHGRWPKPWELACIFLHDVGHLGLQYLDDPAQKAEHWRLGASIAGIFFGWKGYALCAGHCPQNSQMPQSDLYKPDKYSWYIAPDWWMYCNYFAEPGMRTSKSAVEHVNGFKQHVKKSVESGEFVDNHEIFLEMKQNQK
jgi:hypothetical protein